MNFQIDVIPNLDNKTNFKDRFLLLYGSQTGQAQAISEEIHERAPDYNFHADLHCLSKIDKKFNLEKESVAVFVVSTTGEGDPPETALKFWKRLKKITLPDQYLSHLKYCLLGLGDSNYNNFAKFGKNLDKRLQQLGATKFIDSEFADDATGLDVVAEPWISKLWQTLPKVLQTQSKSIFCDGDIVIEKVIDKEYQQKNKQAAETKSIDEQNMTAITLMSGASLKNTQLNLPSLPKPLIKLQFEESNFMSCNHQEISREFPLAVSNVKYVKLKNAIKLTKEDAKKTVLELSLNLADTDLSFQPGDSFGIICENDSEEVQLLIDRLDLSNIADLAVKVQPIDNDNGIKTKISVPSHLLSHTSIRHILLTCCDIRAVPKKAFLRVLAEYTTDATEKRRLQELSSRQGSNEYNTLIREQSLSCLDLLFEFTSCKPSIERVLENLTPLQARPYSVANFSNSDEIRFAFTVVEFDKMKYHYAKRRGVCTSWLDKISRRIQMPEPSNEELGGKIPNMPSVDNQKIGIFKRKSTGFHLPEDPSVPIIMICAGTGIAPFIGFLEYRHEQHESGIKSKHWLIFGCRNEENDFLYKEEIEHFRTAGTLDNLSLAVSQSTTQKPRYVQDVIKEEAEKFVQWITEMRAVIYVCGDVKNMMKDVRSRIEDCLAEQKGMDKELAKTFVQELQDKKLYLQDIWL